MERLEPDDNIVQGIKQGLTEEGYVPPQRIAIHLTTEEAINLNAVTGAARLESEIDALEDQAARFGKIAEKDARFVLELLGGEEQARETMGDAATDHLLQMIIDQTHE